jgi:hypothetical protein
MLTSSNTAQIFCKGSQLAGGYKCHKRSLFTPSIWESAQLSANGQTSLLVLLTTGVEPVALVI